MLRVSKLGIVRAKKIKWQRVKVNEYHRDHLCNLLIFKKMMKVYLFIYLFCLKDWFIRFMTNMRSILNFCQWYNGFSFLAFSSGWHDDAKHHTGPHVFVCRAVIISTCCEFFFLFVVFVFYWVLCRPMTSLYIKDCVMW